MDPGDRNANSIAADATEVSPVAVQSHSAIGDSVPADATATSQSPSAILLVRERTAIGVYVARRFDPFSLDGQKQTALTLAAGILAVAALFASFLSTGVEGYGAVPVEHEGSPRLIVDVESAEWTDFALLPGVGRTLAQRMVEARDAAGDEVTPETFEAVRGVGPKIWRRIEPYLKFPEP